VIGAALYFVWPAGSPRTPEETVEVAQQAVDDRNWDRLYDLTHSEFRQNRISRWRKHLRSILEQGQDLSVSPEDLKALSNRQVFRTYLEALSQDRRATTIINAYGSAETTIRQENAKIQVELESRIPLPYRTVYLKQESQIWKLYSID